MQLNDDELQNLALLQIEDLLQLNRKSLRDYPPMPLPKDVVRTKVGNKLIHAERDYNKEQLTDEFRCLLTSLTGYTLLYNRYICKVIFN